MHIGILKAGGPPRDMIRAPSYPEMIRAALGASYTYCEYDVVAGVLPDAGTAADAYIITGSGAGVHDAAPWMGRLRVWLSQADPDTPLVGICFGHQIMGLVYGGQVEACRRGWGIGLHEYAVCSREKWIDDVNKFVLPVVHRDQIVSLPSAARVVAASDFCPHALLAYDDRYAISFQSHPEFSIDFASSVVDRCEEIGVINGLDAVRARESLRLPHDCTRVAHWIRRFLERRECL